MSHNSLIDRITDFSEVGEPTRESVTVQNFVQAKVAGLDRSQLAQHAKALEQKLARQKKAKQRQQQLDNLVSRADFALAEAESRHQQTDSLHQSLMTLKEKIELSIKDKQYQLDADREILDGYSGTLTDLRQSKHQAEQVLGRVAQLTDESQELTQHMSQMLVQSHESQQQNHNLNQQLRQSLEESRQQQDKLDGLIEQCNLSQDKSLQELDSNRLVSEQLLERARTTCHQVEQGRLDADQLINDLNHNKVKAEEFISLLADLGKTGAENQLRNRGLNNQLEQSLKVSEESRALLMDLQADCRNAKNSAVEALEVSQANNAQSVEYMDELKTSLVSVEKSQLHANDLLGNFQSASKTLEQKLATIDRVIRESSDSHRESKQLNHESGVVIEQSKAHSEKLALELESSLTLNQQYQDRLKRAEKNLAKTSNLQKKYKELYEKSLTALEDKAELLDEAKGSLDASKSTQLEFTNTVQQFQQSTELAQKMVLESQDTLKQLLFEKQPIAQAVEKRVKECASIDQADLDLPIFPQDEEFDAGQEFEPLPVGDNHEHHRKNGFFRFMMIIALLLPVSFIAGSAIRSSAAIHQSYGFGDRLLTVTAIETESINAHNSQLTDSAAAAMKTALFQWPVQLAANSRHEIAYAADGGGINILAENGQSVFAVSSGEVIYVGDNQADYGKMVMIKHNEHLISVYAGYTINRVELGDQVSQGQLIANVGSSLDDGKGGLYFEVRYDGKAEDPFAYLSAQG